MASRRSQQITKFRSRISELEVENARLREACRLGSVATEDRFTGGEIHTDNLDLLRAIQTGLIACRDAISPPKVSEPEGRASPDADERGSASGAAIEPVARQRSGDGKGASPRNGSLDVLQLEHLVASLFDLVPPKTKRRWPVLMRKAEGIVQALALRSEV